MLYESPAYRVFLDDGIATLWLDFRHSPRQTFESATLIELGDLLKHLGEQINIDVLVLRHSCPGIFCDHFDPDTSGWSFTNYSQIGQRVTQQLEQLPFPTLAVIQGRALGTGLELALACSEAIIENNSDTTLGFETVAQGYLPAWGTIDRLRRRLGYRRAKAILTRAKRSNPTQGWRAGLTNQPCEPMAFAAHLQSTIDRLQDRGAKRPWAPPIWAQRLQAKLFPGPKAKNLVEQQLEQLLQTSWRSSAETLIAERAAIEELYQSEATQFQIDLGARLQREPRLAGELLPGLAKLPERIGILGAGTMGMRLARVLGQRGYPVIVQEKSAADAELARVRWVQWLNREVEQRRLSTCDRDRLTNAAEFTSEWRGFEQVELVLEASTEDPGTKLHLLHDLEKVILPRTIIASTSATLPIDGLQHELSRPQRLIGLTFSVVDAYPSLAQIVAGSQTDALTQATLIRWAHRFGWRTVRTNDRPGRLLDHVLLAYLDEANALMAEGLSPWDIDRVATKRGFSQAPLQWCDALGFDRLRALTQQVQITRDDGYARHLLFERMTPYGWNGLSTGEGFYRYGWWTRANEVARMVKWRDLDEHAHTSYIHDVRETVKQGGERLVLRVINEAARCLTDEPDADPGLVDAALALGIGLLPGQGGPLRYADQLGLTYVAERLTQFSERFGRRFEPCLEIARRAAAAEPFYDAVPVPELYRHAA